MITKTLGRVPLVLTLGFVAGVAAVTGCQASEPTAPVATSTPTAKAAPTSTPTPTPTKENRGVEPTLTPAVVLALSEDEDNSASYLLLNQRWIEGLYAQEVDLDDVDAVFWHIFSRLPREVTVFPSENYFYYILYVDGRQIWGNIRLPAGRRERGVLSFAYFEFVEFTGTPGSGPSRAKFYTKADGLTLRELDPFKWEVTYNRKSVIFNLHRLSQDSPNLFPLGEDEVFVERTFDESGYQFFLLFNQRTNYFFWVLNEEEEVPDELAPVQEDLLVGRRSGFAFWVDEAHGGRKVLAAIRRLSVIRNDYYDGPFDQLADNYVEESQISEYMVKANPALEGRIDKYGYYTDTERPLRVALSAYGTYFTTTDLERFLARAKAADDPYRYISRGGVPLPVTPTPQPSSSPTP